MGSRQDAAECQRWGRCSDLGGKGDQDQPYLGLASHGIGENQRPSPAQRAGGALLTGRTWLGTCQLTALMQEMCPDTKVEVGWEEGETVPQAFCKTLCLITQ